MISFKVTKWRLIKICKRADLIFCQRPHLDLCNKVETLQYNAALDPIGVIRGSPKEIMFQEMQLKNLS